MQANGPARRPLDVPAVVCAVIALAIAYAYTLVMQHATASGDLAGTTAYLEIARGGLQVGRALMVATAVLLLLRAVDVRIPSTVTRTVFTGGMVIGMSVSYVLVRWDAL
jgi:hypothetical protein